MYIIWSFAIFYKDFDSLQAKRYLICSVKTLPHNLPNDLILLRRRPLSYRNQSIDLRSKSVDWFLYDNGLRLERVNISGIYYKNAHIRKEHTLYLMKNKYLLVMVLLEKFFQTVFTLKS